MTIEQSSTPTDNELDLTGYLNDEQDNLDESKKDSSDKQQSSEGLSENSADSGGGEVKKKKSPMKMYAGIAGVLIILVLGFSVYNTVQQAKKNSGNSTSFTIPDDPEAETQPSPQEAPQQTPKDFRADISVTQNSTLLARVSSLESELNIVKTGVEGANVAISQRLLREEERNQGVENSVNALNEKISLLVTEGDNKFVDQSKQIQDLENRLTKRFEKEISALKAQLKKAERSHKESRKSTYEVLSVIKDKIRLVNTQTKEELTLSAGQNFIGYGKVQSIDIFGCITLASGQVYSPLNARCDR